MFITKPCVVTLTWSLTDAQNRPIDELKEPTEFFFGGSDLLPKVEEAIDGYAAGFETQLQLEPEHAFGEYDPKRVCFEDRKLFPDALEEGMQVEGLPAGAVTPGMPEGAVYTVTEIYPSHVVLDGNHPLAGIALRIALKVRGVREATEEEVEAGSLGTSLVALADTAPPDDAPIH